MDHSLLVGFVICHSFGLLLSGFLISLDVRAPRSSLKSDFEKPSAIFCGIAQVAILAAAVTSIAISLVNGQQVVWLEAAQFSVLQVHSGINLTYVVRHLAAPCWIPPLVYAASTLFTVLEFVYSVRRQVTPPTHDPFLYLVLPPAFALGMSGWRLYEHRSSGGLNTTYVRLLIALLASNAAAALCQLGGAMFIYVYLIEGNKISTRSYWSILLACISTQLLCSLALCSAGITRIVSEGLRVWRGIKRIVSESLRVWRGLTRSTSLRNSDVEGAMRLDSL